MGGEILRYACSPMLTYGRYAALRLASQALSFPALAAKSLRSDWRVSGEMGIIGRIGIMGENYITYNTYFTYNTYSFFPSPHHLTPVLKLAFLRPAYRPPICGLPSVKTAITCRLAPPNRLCRVSVTPAARPSKPRYQAGRYYRLSVCSNAPSSRYGVNLRLSLHNFGNSVK